MFRNLLFLFLLVSLYSCDFGKSDRAASMLHERSIREMIDTDRDFSAACKQEGLNAAFLKFSADDAVLLRPDNLPIMEADVIKFISSQEDTSFTMSWETKGADLAASNDLGYTFGVYTVETNSEIFKGTYLSIWKKQPDGSWKFVLDTGNSGIGTDIPTE
jgi:ketosteroid isomerase-like protein